MGVLSVQITPPPAGKGRNRQAAEKQPVLMLPDS